MPVLFVVFSIALIGLLLSVRLTPSAATACVMGVGYGIFGLTLLRADRLRSLLPRWLPFVAAALAILEIVNVYLEQFVGLAAPANAIVPASFMALLVLTASTVAVVAASGGIVRAVLGSVVTIAGAMLMAVTAILFAVKATRSGVLWVTTVSNANLHLTIPLLVALLAGAAGATVSRFAIERGHQTCIWISLAAVPLLIIGIAALVRASALARSERPALVMSGMLACAIALSMLPSFLAQRNETTRAIPASSRG